jgi:hypothetical protein
MGHSRLLQGEPDAGRQVSPAGWFALGFLLGSLSIGLMALYFHLLVRQEFDDLHERLSAAAIKVADAERWAAVLGASLYGESKEDTD